jgi:hypothetical protein
MPCVACRLELSAGAGLNFIFVQQHVWNPLHDWELARRLGTHEETFHYVHIHERMVDSLEKGLILQVGRAFFREVLNT